MLFRQLFLCTHVTTYIEKAAKKTFVWKTRTYNIDEIDGKSTYKHTKNWIIELTDIHFLL